MYRFLKDELGVRSLVSGTQLGYSPVGIQAGLDYIDAHAYWNHPRVSRPAVGLQELDRAERGPGELARRHARGAGGVARGRHAVHRQRVQPSAADRLRGRRVRR